MTVVTMDRSVPTATGDGRQQQHGSSAEHCLDLCGLDYYERRQQLLVALRALRPDQVLRLTSDQADDVCWLRYEAEARISQRYRWSLPLETSGAAEIVVRLP